MICKEEHSESQNYTITFKIIINSFYTEIIVPKTFDLMMHYHKFNNSFSCNNF
jgi:hypothetical protein